MLVQLGRLCGSAGLALLVILMSAPAGLAQTSWQIEQVDTLGDVGEDVSLAIDNADHLHISYLDATNANIMYAYYNGAAWVTEVVDGSVDGNINGTSIAVDSGNTPHIAYNDGFGNLKYASRIGDNNWDVEFVDTAGDNTGWYPSLALDSENRPYIAYLAEDTLGRNEDLRFASYFNGGWYVHTPDGDGNNIGPSLALDASGNPHIAYTNSPGGGLYYISAQILPGGGPPTFVWTTEIIEDNESLSGDISLAISSIGDAHIAYSNDGNLKYARRYNISGTWTVETVDAQDRVGTYNSLAFDSQGWPRISYYDNETNAIKYASYSTADGWQTEVVDPLGGPVVGVFDGFTSLAFDSQDHPHIAYHNPDNHDLMHATREFGGPPTNSPPTVDAGGPYSGAEGSPIALDGAASDPDNDPLNTTWVYRVESADPGTTCAWGNDSQVDTTFTCTDDGAFTVSLHASDNLNAPVSDSATVTISNVAPTVTLGGDAEISEGQTFTASGSFSDPGANDSHTATVDYGDGAGEQPLTLNTDGTFTLSHDYPADDGLFDVEVCVEDDDQGSACDEIQVTVLNVAPTITDMSVELDGSEATVTVSATDPAGENDPLSYAFDCDRDGEYEVAPQSENSATCTFFRQEGTFFIGIQVSDGDGGVTTDWAGVIFPTNLCASDYTGVLRYSDTCHDHETAITLPDDLPVELCANTYSGALRVAGARGCSRYDIHYLLPEDGPLHVCVNRYSRVMRVVDDLGQCSSSEFWLVIAAKEVGDLPPPPTR